MNMGNQADMLTSMGDLDLLRELVCLGSFNRSRYRPKNLSGAS